MIKENTIYCKLMGQMGNQMFQIAAVIAHSLRHKKQYVFPQRSGKRDQFPMMFPHLSTLHEYPLPINGFYREEKFGRYFEIPQSANYLVGYFQSSKYFEDYLVKVIEAFQLPKYEQRLNETISMHIRRGDSLSNERLNQPSLKYFHDAIEHFPDRYKVLIFTDDIVWAKENFKGDRFTISDKQDPKSALTEMSSCQPTGTKVKTISGEVNIEDLKVGDRVISYSHTNSYGNENVVTKLIGTRIEEICNPDTLRYKQPISPVRKGGSFGRKINNISKRRFAGNLIQIDTVSGKKTRYTPDHICIAKIGSAFKDKYVIYLMQRENQFRVGITSPRTHKHGRKKSGIVGTSDVRIRFSSSKADFCWILTTKDNKQEALLEESFVSSKFGIPQNQFRGRGEEGIRIDGFWKRFGDNVENGINCLKSYNRDIRYPYIQRGKKVHLLHDSELEIHACNLVDGMSVLDADMYMSIDNGLGNCLEAWVPIKTSNSYYEGDVYSMDIDINNTYIGDNIVTHNCIHHIITNSTFSWWGAYLDLNTHSRYGGTVICPSKHTWFSDKYKEHLTAEDIVEDNWIQIDI